MKALVPVLLTAWREVLDGIRVAVNLTIFVRFNIAAAGVGRTPAFGRHTLDSATNESRRRERIARQPRINSARRGRGRGGLLFWRQRTGAGAIREAEELGGDAVL